MDRWFIMKTILKNHLEQLSSIFTRNRRHSCTSAYSDRIKTHENGLLYISQLWSIYRTVLVSCYVIVVKISQISKVD